MRLFLSIVLVLVFLSCNKSGKSKDKQERIFGEVQAPIICNKNSKNKFVYDLMHDSYLWSSETKILSQQSIFELKDDEAVLSELSHGNDRFSYIMTKKDHDDFFEAGVNKGFGFRPSLVRDGQTLYVNIDFVYPNSPADKVGLSRGDNIEFIDGFTIDKILDSNELYEKYFTSKTEELTISVQLKDLRILSLSKEEFETKTILHRSIKEVDGIKVGYLVFQSFISPAYDSLEKSFKYFKEQGIHELVLDLRYNGGGYINIANYLSSLIGGENVKDRVFNKTIFNQKYSINNSVEKFQENLEYSLNLSRVFIITTENSCSASELVINALISSDNDIDVIQIGSKTCGKPYGMIGGPFCDKYILPVQIRSENGVGNGDYVNGIIPDCQSIDDISRDFGDVNESSLFGALYFIKNGECRKTSRSKVSERKEILKGFNKLYGLY